MLTFIILLVFGLIIAFFAGQNTAPITISFSGYQLPTVPLYVVIIGGMLVGFVASWIISLVDSMFTVFALRGKESKIQTTEKKITKLNEQIHELELENARLKGENKEPIIVEEPESQLKPSLFHKVTHSLH